MIDRHAAAWVTLRRHIIAEIEKHRSALETNLDADATAGLRGRIIALRALVAAVEPQVRETGDDQPSLYDC